MNSQNNLSLNGPFLSVNKRLLQEFKGELTSVLILSLLLETYSFILDSSKENDGVLSTISFIENALGVDEGKQRRALTLLVQKNLLKINYKGYPKQRYIKLNIPKIREMLIKQAVTIKEIKEDFYKRLNMCIYSNTIQEMKNFESNIDFNSMQVIYAWSHLYKKACGILWNWDSKTYGTFFAYIKPAYILRKRFDFLRLYQYHLTVSANKPFSIQNFIEHDRTIIENAPPLRLSIIDFLEKIKEVS